MYHKTIKTGFSLMEVAESVCQISTMIHVNITIKGKVQKIGLRFLTMQTAIKIGVNGFVKPLDKDKIYIEAEGTEEKIEDLKNWCNAGPYPKAVSQVSIEKGQLKNFKSFEIVNR